MHIGIAADHGGFELKRKLAVALRAAGHEIIDFGAYDLVPEDDYPDFVIPLAQAVAKGEVARGVTICRSGVGACISANKITGVRAASITDDFSAHQGVEDDNMNVLCLGSQISEFNFAWYLVELFLNAHFDGAERFKRRLSKVSELENSV